MDDEEKTPRIWEHAWSTEEIRKNSCNWTLAGDVGILNHLQDFSHKLISRTLEMEKTVDSLVHKSKVASAKVNNVINDFQMLSNLQFVENRVYDEEVQEPEPTSTKEVQPKTKEQREAEMLPRITRALELGVSVLDKAFDRIEVDETSDSEDDDEDAVSRGRTILEPKDNYEHRPLPYVIGSVEFQNDDYAGLHSFVDDEPSMESTQDDNVSSSSSSSTSESEEEFDEPYISKQQPSIDGQHRNTVLSVDTMKTKYSDSESSDLFDGGEEENGYISSSPAEKKQDANSTVNPLMEELMRKSKPVPSSDSVSTRKPETIQSPVVNNGRKASDDLFGGDSGDELFQDDYSPFHKKSLFSSDGIFDSGKDGKSDDESDLFSEDKGSSKRKQSVSKVKVLPSPVSKVQVLPSPSTKALVSSTKSTPTKTLENEDDDLFGEIKKSDSPERKPAPLTKVQVLPSPLPKSKVLPEETIPKSKEIKKNKEPDLFGDDDDEGDDLFSSLSTRGLSSLQKGQPITSKVAVVESSKKSEKSMPSPSVSERSNKSLFDTAKEPSESASLFDDDSDSDLFSSTNKTTNQKTFNFNFAADAAGDEEDDLFSIKPVSKQAKPSKPEASEGIKSSQKKAVSLFEESDSFDLFKPAEPKQKAEDLFATTLSKSNVPEKDASQLESSATSQKQATLLFDESDSFDLFLPVNSKDEKKSEPVKVDKTPKETKKDQVPISAQKDISEVANTIQPQTSYVKPTQPDTTGNDDVEVVASFDNPSDTGSTLNAINKGRAKIQAKRKKPTRKHRQACISADLEEANPEVDAETISVIPPPTKASSSPSSDLFGQVETNVIKVEPVSSVPPSNISPSAHKKKENDKKNLMSQLMLEAQNSKLLKQNASAALGDEDDDLFSSKPLGTVKTSRSEDFSVVSPTAQMPDKVLAKTNTTTTEGPKPEGSSLLLSDSTSDEDLFSASAFKDFRNSLSKNSIFEQDDDDDDIFKSHDTKDNLSRHSSEVLGDASDDIFASVQKEKYEMFPTQVFDDDDDDDDIFSNLTVSSSKKVETKKDQKPKPSKKSEDDIFDDPLGVA